MDSWFTWDGDDLLLQLKLQPKASRNAFAGPLGDRLKIQITAPPVDGQANALLGIWLAKQFGVAKSAVVLEAGGTNPLKRVRIVTPKRLPVALAGALRK